MKSWILKNYEMILTVLISIMICTTRSSMAFGNFIYGLIVLVTLLTWWYKRDEVSIPNSIRQYGWAYLGMLLCILPSAFISDNIRVTTFNYRTNLAIYQEFSQIIYYFINIFCVYRHRCSICLCTIFTGV